MIDISQLTDLLIKHEGLRLKPYKDHLGFLTIGVGRNLEGRGISKDEALYLLDNDIDEWLAALNARIPWWTNLNPDIQMVLVDMCHQLGVSGLMRFEKFLRHLKDGNYKEAALEMLLSTWASQTPNRAKELSDMVGKSNVI